MKAYELMAKAAAEPEKYEGKKFKVIEGAVIDTRSKQYSEFHIRNGTLVSGLYRLYVTDYGEVEEILQPVSFVEAVKAHSEGKTVRVVYPSFNDKDRKCEIRYWIGDKGDDCGGTADGLTFYMIREGVWYIES